MNFSCFKSGLKLINSCLKDGSGAGQNDYVHLNWPPRSPNIRPCVFPLWGYIKDKVYTPHDV